MIVAWLVFVVDFVVHQRRLVRYLATWWGRFDFAVVVLTGGVVAATSSPRPPAVVSRAS